MPTRISGPHYRSLIHSAHSQGTPVPKGKHLKERRSSLQPTLAHSGECRTGWRHVVSRTPTCTLAPRPSLQASPSEVNSTMYCTNARRMNFRDQPQKQDLLSFAGANAPHLATGPEQRRQTTTPLHEMIRPHLRILAIPGPVSDPVSQPQAEDCQYPRQAPLLQRDLQPTRLHGL